MHDTAVALVSRDGEVLFAASLERLSRVKQDGRPPGPLLAGLPWELIDTVAVSTEARLELPSAPQSVLHPQPLREPRAGLPWHGAGFNAHLDALPPAEDLRVPPSEPRGIRRSGQAASRKRSA